jgi:hypothetical protein
MPIIENRPLKIVQLRLYEEDVARLKKLFGDDVGYNKAVRAMVHKMIKDIDTEAEKKFDL